MKPRKYTKTAFINYVQGMIALEDQSIRCEMEIIENGNHYAPDVVNRADKVRNYLTAKHTLERLIKYIDHDWK
jgi:hypothetical protein